VGRALVLITMGVLFLISGAGAAGGARPDLG
jgi:hypothetical protein